eukprot:GGOE01021445.1.p1 GENE.GGOE01021445.1~~GGOE01021445.1.p1  ORF type:complete len:652 (-),score=58.04 GGOE01021445.1:226-2142(-)
MEHKNRLQNLFKVSASTPAAVDTPLTQHAPPPSAPAAWQQHAYPQAPIVPGTQVHPRVSPPPLCQPKLPTHPGLHMGSGVDPSKSLCGLPSSTAPSQPPAAPCPKAAHPLSLRHQAPNSPAVFASQMPVTSSPAPHVAARPVPPPVQENAPAPHACSLPVGVVLDHPPRKQTGPSGPDGSTAHQQSPASPPAASGQELASPPSTRQPTPIPTAVHPSAPPASAPTSSPIQMASPNQMAPTPPPISHALAGGEVTADQSPSRHPPNSEGDRALQEGKEDVAVHNQLLELWAEAKKSISCPSKRKEFAERKAIWLMQPRFESLQTAFDSSEVGLEVLKEELLKAVIKVECFPMELDSPVDPALPVDSDSATFAVALPDEITALSVDGIGTASGSKSECRTEMPKQSAAGEQGTRGARAGDSLSQAKANAPEPSNLSPSAPISLPTDAFPSAPPRLHDELLTPPAPTMETRTVPSLRAPQPAPTPSAPPRDLSSASTMAQQHEPPSTSSSEASGKAADRDLAPRCAWTLEEQRELQEAEELLRRYQEWVQAQPPDDPYQHTKTRKACETLLQEHGLRLHDHCLKFPTAFSDVCEVMVQYYSVKEMDGDKMLSVKHVGPNQLQACTNALELLMRKVECGQCH